MCYISLMSLFLYFGSGECLAISDTQICSQWMFCQQRVHANGCGLALKGIPGFVMWQIIKCYFWLYRCVLMGVIFVCPTQPFCTITVWSVLGVSSCSPYTWHLVKFSQYLLLIGFCPPCGGYLSTENSRPICRTNCLSSCLKYSFWNGG